MTRRQVSKAEYEVKSERDVYVPMRDGIKLCVDIFRPKNEPGKFPALLALSPYGKAMQTMPMTLQAHSSPLINLSIEAGDPQFLVPRGYVHVIGDVRGTGKSEGEYYGWMSKKEAEDGYDLVEWIAKQPWCNGKVGMVGISYYGTIQLIIAAEKPPHLIAIMPWNAPADFYRECTHHGGIIQMFFHFLYSQKIHGRHASVAKKYASREEFERTVSKIKQNPDLNMYPDLYSLIDNPDLVPNFFDVLYYETDGPFYWERSPYTKFERIKIPFYTSSGWWAYGHMHLAGAFANYTEIDAPKKLLINSKLDYERPLPLEYNEEVVSWYDYWLKDLDTGVMEEKPIKIYVMGANKFRFENEWPLARTRWTNFYLRSWGRLTQEPSENQIEAPDSFIQMPPNQTATVNSLKYQTSPVNQDLEVTGPIALDLLAGVDHSDANWIISLRDVGEDGREVELSKGFLKASHRAFDEKKSTPWHPYHPHTNPEGVEPGKIYLYRIELSPTSNVFKENHSIQLVISGMDHQFSNVAPASLGRSHLPYHICSSKTTVYNIYHDIKHPSHLVLPMIPSEVF